MESNRRFKTAAAPVCVAIAAMIALAPPALAQGRAGVQSETFPIQDSEFNLLDEPERKDPFVAGVLSWSWTGLGQFYTQHYTRGSLFLLTDIAQKGLLVYMLFYYSDKYRSDDDNVVRWEDISMRDRGIMIGYVFSLLFVKVLSVVDAVRTAEDYNREIYFPYWKYRNRSRFRVESSGKSIEISAVQPVSF